MQSVGYLQNSWCIAEETRETCEFCGTLGYMAPELLSRDSYGDPASYPRQEYHKRDHQAADVWAAACTAYGIVFGRELFPVDSSLPVDKQIADVCKQHRELVSCSLNCVFLCSIPSQASMGRKALFHHIGFTQTPLAQLVDSLM